VQFLLAQPDELALGYEGRTAAFNGFRSLSDLHQAMAARLGIEDTGRRSLTRVDLLAQASGIDVPGFVVRHTTLPIRRAVTSFRPDLQHGSGDGIALLWRSALQTARPGAYACPACVEEDLDFHGFSYWRRVHQIPGLHFCQKHPKQALYFVRESHAFRMAPSVAVALGTAPDSAWLKNIRQSEAVARFTEICSELLSMDRPAAASEMAKLVKEKCRAKGLNTHRRPTKALLSDHVLRSFPSNWLATVYPALCDKPPGSLFPRIDALPYSLAAPSSPTAYILAAASLWEDTDDALIAFKRAATIADSPSAATDIECRADKPDAEATVRAYVEGRGSAGAVARTTGVDRKTAIARLERLGLPHLGGPQGKRTLQAAEACLLRGVGLKEAFEGAGLGGRDLEVFVRSTCEPLRRALQGMELLRKGRGTGQKRQVPALPPAAQTKPRRALATTGPRG
jgi:hypothetical protein